MSEAIKPDKFREQDIPLILEALKEAHEQREKCQVVVSFAADGGVVSITRESHKRYKG